MTTPRDEMVSQIDTALIHYMNIQTDYAMGNSPVSPSPVVQSEAGAFCAAAVAAVENASGYNSNRSIQARRCVEDFYGALSNTHPWRVAPVSRLKGILDELRSALMAGYLVSYGERIRGEVFIDVLAMADHLLDEDLKDPAAVVVGTALEVHLRALCMKNGIDTTVARGAVDVPKKATVMNDDLKKQGVYTGVEQAQVQAWQRLRNEAAHGHFSEYDKAQVAQMVQGVRDFIAKYPA